MLGKHRYSVTVSVTPQLKHRAALTALFMISAEMKPSTGHVTIYKSYLSGKYKAQDREGATMADKAYYSSNKITIHPNEAAFIKAARPFRRLKSILGHAANGALTPITLACLPAAFIYFASGGGVAQAAQNGADNLSALQAAIAAQQAKLQQEEIQLEQQSLELDQQQRLLDSQMAKLRGAGTSSTSPAPIAADAAASSSNTSPAAATQTGPANGTVGEEQQQQQQTNQQEQTKVILQSSTVLANTGGVLTPKGKLIIDPSIEYDYWAQNQLSLNGFTIIPGITFGNIFIARVDQNFLTASLTARYGLTDRLEINAKIPLVVGYGTFTAQAAGPNAQPITASANNINIGDIQLGGSYQFNNGDNGWPVFVGNLTFKTVTGVSPYSVPIYTVYDNQGSFLGGIQKKLPTGTGFYSLEPSVTVFYPTAPGVLFGNLQYIYNFSRSFNILTSSGGLARENLEPGGAVAATFGMGFALNDKASMTLSYQQEHVFGSSANNHAIPGSAYDFGTFNFGLGYAINARTNFNIGVGIGAGPNAPVAKILFELPVRF